MRKRKSPIVLVTVLVIMASVAFGIQYTASKGSSPADAPPAPQVKDVTPVGEARAKESASSVAQGVRGAMSSPKSPAPETMERSGMPGAPTGPMILKPAASMARPEKPKPNTSSTSAQWYNDESALGSDKDKG